MSLNFAILINQYPYLLGSKDLGLNVWNFNLYVLANREQKHI